MRITTSTAATICNISGSYALRLARALKIKLDRQRVPGNNAMRTCWGARHVVGLLALPALGKAGLSDDDTAAVANMVGSLASDELFEAYCAAGRSWVLAIGKRALCELVTLEQVRASATKYAGEIEAAGLEFVAIDLAPLLDDVREAATAAERTETDAQPAE